MLLEVVRGVREERLPAAAVGVRVLSSVAERRQSLEHSTNTELKHQLIFVFFFFPEATCAILRISSRLVFGLTSLATCPFLRGASSGQPHGRPSHPGTLSLSVPCLALKKKIVLYHARLLWASLVTIHGPHGPLHSPNVQTCLILRIIPPNPGTQRLSAPGLTYRLYIFRPNTPPDYYWHHSCTIHGL